MTCKGYKNTKENKISKNTGLIIRAKNILNKDSLTNLQYSYYHCYLNYSNMTWGSTYKTKLDKIQLEQKRLIRLLFTENRFTRTKPLR